MLEPPNARYSGFVPGGREALLLATLEEAAPKSLTFVLISSLRDVSDVLESHAQLFVDKVASVSIMGGLQPDADAPFGWAPDSSVNNLFDRAAAAAVHAFCFEHRIPMTVVSRHAVPMLEMQLARSFAERTNCEVLRYLADAQFLGLEGLWQKLCEGKLPPRCDKQVRAQPDILPASLMLSLSLSRSLSLALSLCAFLALSLSPLASLPS